MGNTNDCSSVCGTGASSEIIASTNIDNARYEQEQSKLMDEFLKTADCKDRSYWINHLKLNGMELKRYDYDGKIRFNIKDWSAIHPDLTRDMFVKVVKDAQKEIAENERKEKEKKKEEERKEEQSNEVDMK
mmetsp:Transcript_23252/g.20426  ORF Transcript_23252/g.20426 Transcript_23252/m.20426 type:complete len:131 (+) Transcript_23252:28-420(+)